MKGLIVGIVVLVVIALAGFFYRNALERPAPSGACPADTMTCPDGSVVSRVEPNCNFAACPAPNVSLSSAGIVYDLPAGYFVTTPPDADTVAAYSELSASTTSENEILVKEYSIPSGETALNVIDSTAVSDASGAPVSPSAFSAATLGGTTFSMVILGQYGGTVHVAYYLPQGGQVLRFDSIDQSVSDWSDPALDVTTLPADSALRQMLSTLQTTQ